MTSEASGDHFANSPPASAEPDMPPTHFRHRGNDRETDKPPIRFVTEETTDSRSGRLQAIFVTEETTDSRSGRLQSDFVTEENLTEETRDRKITSPRKYVTEEIMQ
jgi:hypothetical protein